MNDSWTENYFEFFYIVFFLFLNWPDNWGNIIFLVIFPERSTLTGERHDAEKIHKEYDFNQA